MHEARASQTAEFIALFRAIESVRPADTRLFDDPFAIAFLSGSLRRVARLSARPLAGRLIRSVIDTLYPGARPAGVARTRLIDDALQQALSSAEFEQVVLLGAGFDARAHRLPCLANVLVIEVDHPNTLAEKRRRIEPIAGSRPERLAYVALDFDRQSLVEALAEAGFDPQRQTFFLWEGVTNYLSEHAVDSTLRFVGSTAAGSRLLFTYVHDNVFKQDSGFRGTWFLRRTLRRASEPWTFGLDPSRLAAYLQARGLALVRDEGSREYRERYLGASERLLRGYEFYRAAIADVAPRPS